MIIRIRFGGRQICDLPFLRKLAAEMHRAVNALLALPKHHWVNSRYADRRNPTFSRLAALLTFPEHKALETIVTAADEIGAKTLCPIFD
eukprot:2060469-Pyramimonas_sp.AAC.2